MINNRQNGRRRGRGGGGARTPNNAPNMGNRQDNRSRGNAAQLHEKYKALARDAQLAGDRVQTEYYLQFADHYFRVLGESRSRFEEQNQRRPRDEYDAEGEEGDDEAANAADADEGEEGDEQPHQRREAGREGKGEQRPRRQQSRRDRDESDRGDRNGRARETAGNDEGEGEERIALDVLPPAISVIDGGEDAPRAPRRRTRRPRNDEDETEIAPAA